MTDATPTSNDQTPRYQCFADGCPANHASKWQVCTLPDDDPLVRVRFLLYTQFIFGTGLTDLQAQILEAAMREIENLRKGHETKPNARDWMCRACTAGPFTREELERHFNEVHPLPPSDLKASAPPCVWRRGCAAPDRCKTEGCCQQIVHANSSENGRPQS